MSDTRPRSISTRGRARRRFIAGTRLWPPARSFASSPRSASRISTSSSVRGVTYSKGAGFTSNLRDERLGELRQVGRPHEGSVRHDRLAVDPDRLLGQDRVGMILTATRQPERDPETDGVVADDAHVLDERL